MKENDKKVRRKWGRKRKKLDQVKQEPEGDLNQYQADEANGATNGLQVP